MPDQSRLSRKQRREAAREEREREAQRRAARRRRRMQVVVVAVVACLAAVGLIIVVGGRSVPSVHDGRAVSSQLAGIPQTDMTLGVASAPVTIHEYGDLQCTACAAFASSTLPALIDRLVKPGPAKLTFHNWTIIDQTDSVAAAKASYAAARQGRAWQFIELFYRNQGDERSGYVTNGFLDALATAAGLDVARFDADRNTPAASNRVRADGLQAVSHGFRGTPSFTVSGPRGTRDVEAGAPGDIRSFEDAVHAVA